MHFNLQMRAVWVQLGAS